MNLLAPHGAAAAIKQALYGRRGEPYQVNGQTLRFTPGSRPVRQRYASSANAVNRYDALQIQQLTAGLKPGDFALDIGGHHGSIALIMAACCGPTGRVITFEPDPSARAAMMRNFDLNPQVRRPEIEAVAVSD